MKYSKFYELPDWKLVKAQLWVESRYKEDAISPVGARGIAQFMPSTWIAVMGKDADIWDVELQIQACCKLMQENWNHRWVKVIDPNYPDRYKVALKIYNGGWRMFNLTTALMKAHIPPPFGFEEHNMCQQMIEYKWSAIKENTEYPVAVWNRYLKELVQ